MIMILHLILISLLLSFNYSVIPTNTFQCNLTSEVSYDSTTKFAITHTIDSYPVLKNIGNLAA